MLCSIKYTYLIPIITIGLSQKNAFCDVNQEYMKKKQAELVSYDDFIKNNPKYKPVKIIGNNFNNFKYSLGINKDYIKFNPKGYCSEGGLYFCDETQLDEYISLGSYGEYIARIKLLSKEPIYIENNKCKTNSFEIEEIIPVSTYINSLSNLEKIKMIKVNILILKYINNQTNEICLEAVKSNGYVLQYVKNQTDEICLEAVKSNGYALQYVKNQTDEICLEAVKSNGYALEYVKNQTDEICLEAVKSNGFALQYVKNQTDEICLEAVKSNGYALQYVINQTDEICLEAVKSNGYALQYVINQTNEICLEANKNIKMKNRNIFK